MSTGTIVLIVFLVLSLPGIVGVFAVLGVYGVRKYIANAKTAEARNTVSFIAKDAVTAYEVSRRFCPSASVMVPSSKAQIAGKKYMSTASEWQVDAPGDAGFACLKFALTMPQYFQYGYTATATDFVAVAHGDLNGDGAPSTYRLSGQLVGDRVVIAPQIAETDPEE